MEPATAWSFVTAAVGDMTSAIATITGWWFVPIAVSMFGAAVVISLVAGFFGKSMRRTKRRRR